MNPLRLLAAVLLAIVVGRAASSPRPNILFIFSDDQRADTIHALGNAHIQTPNLDRLADAGTAFTQAYCMGGLQGAVCVPSRAMLMSGRSLFRVNEQLRGQETWPQRFRQAGYETFICGKWHNGAESLLRSFANGRSLFLGGMGDPYQMKLQDIGPGHKLTKPARTSETHTVEIIANSAIEFLKNRRSEQPFLLYAAMEAPHDPRIAPPAFHATYNANKPPLPRDFLPVHPFDNGEMTVRDECLEAWPRTPDAIRQHLADYYAFITFMDQQIGRILAALSQSGAGTNTIVVFASDQGLAVGSHGLMGKQNLYESGMRVPLIFRGPGIPAGKSTDAFCYLFDVFSTLGARAGVMPPTGNEGRDLAAVWNGTSGGRDTIFTAYRGVQRAVRDEYWKLIRYPQVDVTQLFDLRNDPDETNNLAGLAENAGRVKAMMGLLASEQGAFDDTAPLQVPDAKPAAWAPPVRSSAPTMWHGFARENFKLSGKQCFITKPATNAPGLPWVWRTSFPDFHAEVDRALLSNGWHIGFIDCVDMLGADAALDLYDEFLAFVTARYRLSHRPALEAVSRGGLPAYRFAARRPGRVACIYADTPVMDLKSWPLGWPGSRKELAEALKVYGFKNEAELQAWRGNPVDLLAPIARAGIPLRHVISLNDEVVPPERNTLEARRRIEKLGHSMEIVTVEKGTAESRGHHFPLPAVSETVQFISRHAEPERR